MTDEQKKQDGEIKTEEFQKSEQLPGIDQASPKTSLPGLGPQTGKGLPGLAGPSRAPLPGLGPSKAPLPGIGKASAPVPAFLQKDQPKPEKTGPSPEEMARDPFGQTSAPYPVDLGYSVPAEFPQVAVAGQGLKRDKRSVMILIVACLIGLFVGFFLGTGRGSREEVNTAIRDGLIIQYEIKNVARLFDEVETVMTAAFLKSQKMQFDDSHVGYLTEKVRANPINPTIFTERNYKKFNVMTVQLLMDYNQKWFNLNNLLADHRMATRNDKQVLAMAPAELEKIIKTGYGVIFAHNQENQVLGQLVVMSPGAKEGKFTAQVDTGTFGEEFTLYTDEEKDKLAENIGEYIVPVEDGSKSRLLAKSSQIHFKEYQERLRTIAEVMKSMKELQNNLLIKLVEIASQDPPFLGGMDPEKGLELYKKNSAQPAAEGAPAKNKAAGN